MVNITICSGVLSGGAAFCRRRAPLQQGGDDVVQEGQTMSEGRAQILEMLVAGRVTVEQTDQLLQALDAASPAAPPKPVAPAGGQRRPGERADGFFATPAAR